MGGELGARSSELVVGSCWRVRSLLQAPCSKLPAAVTFSAMVRPHWLPLVFILGIAACEPQAEAPTLDLPPTADTLMLTSGAVTDGAWLHDQLWAVLGPDDATVWLVDFATGSIDALGEPGESYRNPFGIFTFSDTLYVNDWGMGRMTVWSSTGNLVEAPRNIGANV